MHPSELISPSLRALAACIAVLVTVLGAGDALAASEEDSEREGWRRREAELDRVLAEHPLDHGARVERAALRAWQGRYDDSVSDYRVLLEREATDVEALVGMAYALAWAGRYDAAEAAFGSARTLDPENRGARKGLAYVYLWRGENEAATPIFEEIAAADPTDSDARIGLGQARLGLGQGLGAEASFREALELDAESEAAAAGLVAARDAPALLEASVRFGYSSSSEDFGLRHLELGTWLNASTRLWGRFDNTLSLDNPALARSGTPARTYLVGAAHRVTREVFLSGEAGFRELPGADQGVFRLEGSYFASNQGVKLGLQVSPTAEGVVDWLGYGEYDLPLGSRVRLKPQLLYARTGALADDEYRGLLFVEFQAPMGWLLRGAAGVGYLRSAAATSGALLLGLADLSIPIFSYHRIHLSARHEALPENTFTVAMAGLTVRLPR